MYSHYYDYIIIGAGPSGLVLAWLLASNNKKNTILLVDKNESVGGMHRVEWNGSKQTLFSEHSPRVYSSAYVGLKEVLKQMSNNNIRFDDLFTDHAFGTTKVIKAMISTLSIREMVILLSVLMWPPKNAKVIKLKDFLMSHRFSDKATELFDRLARLTEGASISKYSLHQFIMLVDQNALYKAKIPKKPNDTGLIDLMYESIVRLPNVSIMLNTWINKHSITRLNQNEYMLHINARLAFKTKRIVLAVPPIAQIQILDPSLYYATDISNNLDKLIQYAHETQYESYLSLVFHWKAKNIFAGNDDSASGSLNSTEWGLYWLVLTDYMSFDNTKGSEWGTIATITVSLLDTPSSVTGKSANQTERLHDLVREIIRQIIGLNERNSIQIPDDVSLSPSNVRSQVDGKWITTDNASIPFAYTTGKYNQDWLPSGFMSIGPHTESSQYAFNTMETAVVSAAYIANVLDPGLKNGQNAINIINVDKGRKSLKSHLLILIIFIIALIIAICYAIRR